MDFQEVAVTAKYHKVVFGHVAGKGCRQEES